MPTPIITLPIHTIEQARALAGLLRAFIDGQSPDTNDGQDYKPDPDLAGITALWCHLDAGIADVAALPKQEPSRKAPDGYTIHVFTMPGDDENDECEMYQWEHVSGEVSGHLEGDKFVRDSFGSWDDAVADIREQQSLTD